MEKGHGGLRVLVVGHGTLPVGPVNQRHRLSRSSSEVSCGEKVQRFKIIHGQIAQEKARASKEWGSK